jgi:glycine betaine/proline transport system substrate-binding protein
MNQLSPIRRWAVVSAALVCFATSLVAGAAESRAETVKIGYFTTYLPSEIEAHIIATIAREYPQLGVSDIEFIGTDVAPAWIGLRRGDIDVLVEVDLPNQQHLLDEAEGQADVLSQLFADAGQGFFVPRFSVEGPDAPATGLKSIDQLNEYKDVFDGTLHDESPGWQSTKFNAIRLEAYGLDFKHIKLSDAALVAQVQRAYERKEPILFFFYHPHWLFERFDVVKLDEPDTYRDGCFTEGNGRCPVPSFSAWVAARNDLAERTPKFYSLLKNVTLSIEEVETLLFKIDREDQPVEEAAKAWVDSHRGEIDEWVKQAAGG